MGTSAKDFIEGSLQMELGVADKLRSLCRASINVDEGTYLLAQRLLEETESDHILWLEQQLTLIDQVGEQNYLAQMMRAPDAGA